MTAVTTTRRAVTPPPAERSRLGETLGAIAILARRRFALSAQTPREVIVPLLPPVLFAAVIAPALAESTGDIRGIDYLSFVAVGTIGLLIPVSCVFGGVGVIVDRDSGAQKDLLAAPIPRSSLVLGNLVVAVCLSVLQVGALLAVAVLRGASFHATPSAIGWTAATTLALAVAMHSTAEILAARIPTQEEYVGAAPPVALLPWFFAGSFFPIASLPAGLTLVAKLLPLTHGVALMRYGLVDPHGTGLKDIWGLDNVALMAFLSLAVMIAFAAVTAAVSIRTFTRSSTR